jgi:AraC-like DNA-binding protein
VRQAITLIKRGGARDIVIAGLEDQPSAMRTIVGGLTSDALAQRLLELLRPPLALLPTRVERAIRMLFVIPGRFRHVDDIAAAAGMTHRHLSREMSRAGLATGWHFLVIARVIRAYRLLGWEEHTLASAAASLRTAPRILGRHIRLITSVTRSSALLKIPEDELVTRCVHALQRATPEPPDTVRRARA